MRLGARPSAAQETGSTHADSLAYSSTARRGRSIQPVVRISKNRKVAARGHEQHRRTGLRERVLTVRIVRTHGMHPIVANVSEARCLRTNIVELLLVAHLVAGEQVALR